MSKENKELIVGLDIGTSKIVAIVAELTADGKLNILGIGSQESKGLKKGMVVNIEATVNAISRAIQEAELLSLCKVKSVFTGMTRFDAFPLRVPTTLVTGERSPKAAQAMVRGLAQVNPGVRVVTLEGAGHMAPLTHAAKVNALMQEHVQAMRS